MWLLLGAAFCLLGLGTTRAALSGTTATWEVVREFAPNVGQVFSGYTFSEPTAGDNNAMTFEEWRAAVAAAFDLGLAGVLDFQTNNRTGSDNLVNNRVFTTLDAQRLGITLAQFTSLSDADFFTQGAGNARQVSGPLGTATPSNDGHIFRKEGSGTELTSYDIGIDGLVTHVGLVLVPRADGSNPRRVMPLSMTAYFSGGGSNTTMRPYFEYNPSTAASNLPDLTLANTFFVLAAPPGETITRIYVQQEYPPDTLVNRITNGPWIDDLSFIVVPEPSTAILGLAGAILWSLWRRGRSSKAL